MVLPPLGFRDAQDFRVQGSQIDGSIVKVEPIRVHISEGLLSLSFQGSGFLA